MLALGNLAVTIAGESQSSPLTVRYQERSGSAAFGWLSQ